MYDNRNDMRKILPDCEAIETELEVYFDKCQICSLLILALCSRTSQIVGTIEYVEPASWWAQVCHGQYIDAEIIYTLLLCQLEVTFITDIQSVRLIRQEL